MTFVTAWFAALLLLPPQSTRELLPSQSPSQVLRHDLGKEFRVGIDIDADGDWLIASVQRRFRERGAEELEARRRVALAFHRREGRWEQHSVLEADHSPRRLGREIAIDGTTAVVGIPGTREHPGRVLVFELRGEVWEHAQTLYSWMLPAFSAPSFGGAVALEGDVLAVSLTDESVVEGAVHVFEREGRLWRRTGRLQRPWQSPYCFGTSIAVASGTVLVGTPGYLFASREPGAVFVYHRVEGGWDVLQALRINPPFSEAGAYAVRDYFGESIAASRDLLVVAAHTSARDEELFGPGQAYLYELRHGQWEPASALNSAELPGEFADTVAVGDNLVAVATTDHAGRWSVQVFQRTDAWNATRTVHGLEWYHDHAPLAVGGGELLIGAPRVDSAESMTGAILVHDASSD